MKTRIVQVLTLSIVAFGVTLQAEAGKKGGGGKGGRGGSSVGRSMGKSMNRSFSGKAKNLNRGNFNASPNRRSNASNFNAKKLHAGPTRNLNAQRINNLQKNKQFTNNLNFNKQKFANTLKQNGLPQKVKQHEKQQFKAKLQQNGKQFVKNKLKKNGFNKPGNGNLVNNKLAPKQAFKHRAKIALKNGGAKKMAKHFIAHKYTNSTKKLLNHCPTGHFLHHHRHAHWWLRFTCGYHDYLHRPLVCNTTYWTAWTPCSYRYIHCWGIRRYVGLECVIIPEIQCLGVQTVEPESPADLAGVAEGDVIVSINGEPPESEDVLSSSFDSSELILEVIRDGEEEPTLLTINPTEITDLN